MSSQAEKGSDTIGMQAPFPVLTARLLDVHARHRIARTALARGTIYVPLETAPMDASTHVLEVQTDDDGESLVILAEPMGPPTADGFPLRLHPRDAAQAEALSAEVGGLRPSPPPVVISPTMPVPRFGNFPAAALTAEHSRALSVHSMSPLQPVPGAHAGRSIAGGRFALETLIGAGASGEVYCARHTTLRKSVAIKILHSSLQHSDEYSARFYSEALAASRLDHRNVLSILDYGQEPDGLLYIVMELLEGRSLEALIDARESFPTARIVDLVVQACAGLAHAHEAGIIHRDIKPANILVVPRRDDDGRTTEVVKVCDFGIAHWTPQAAWDQDAPVGNAASLLDEGSIVGTPLYMAPEQIHGEEVDARTDVYALGVVLYQLATGRLPFEGERPLDVMLAHTTKLPDHPSSINPNIDPRLEALILKALRKNPAERQRDARALRAELQAVRDGGRGLVVPMPTPGAMQRVPNPIDLVANPAGLTGVLAVANASQRPAILRACVEAVALGIRSARLKSACDLVAFLNGRKNGASGEEGQLIERALAQLRDPSTMEPLASYLLSGKANVEDAAPLLVAAGPVAARALIEKRRQGGLPSDGRRRFIAATRAIGPAAFPVLTSTLEAHTELRTQEDELLVEDLLTAFPDVRSEMGGQATVRFVQLDRPALGALALRTTAKVWGRRAQPLLLGVLDGPSDIMRIAAIESLITVDFIDDAVVKRLVGRLSEAPPTSVEMAVLAAAALGKATGSARVRALGFLEQRLKKQGLLGSVRAAFAPREPPEVMAAFARSYFALDPAAARPALERLASSRADVRPELRRILSGA